MQVLEVPIQDCLTLAAKQEDHFYDRKAVGISGAKLQKVSVAFANADGGDVYVGIADDSDEPDPAKRWNGANRIEDYNQLIQALTEVQPPLPMELEFLRAESENKYILHIKIEKSQAVHRTTEGKVYERKGAQSLPIRDPERITALAFAKGATSYEDFVVDGALAENIVDSPVTAAFLASYSPRTDPLALALNRSLIDEKSFKPKVAGLLLFSESPSSKVPKKCSVRIVRYETKEDEPERDQLGPIETLEGPLYDLIHKTVARVT